MNSVALCAGVGMLDEGCAAAFEYLGIPYRVAAYVEREAFAAAQLVALMEAGLLAPAPVWSDLTTFDARPWRGKVDWITGGFPCQPHSVAGKREGVEDERWIWDDIVRIIRDSGAWGVVFENVRGLLSSGGMGPVLASLSGLGFIAEWTVLSAGEVGASHRRERVFIVAYSEHDARSAEWRARSRRRVHQGTRHPARAGRPGQGLLADGAGRGLGELRQPPGGDGQPDGGDAELAYADGDELHADSRRPVSGADGRNYLTGRGPDLADAEGSIRGGELESRSARSRRTGPTRGGELLAHASGARSEGRELGNAYHSLGGGAQAYGPASELCEVFAPGPSDPEWRRILAACPWLAPATQPGVRGVVDGLALVVDQSRRDQLRAIGNGVVPLEAAAAIVGLVWRLTE